jgi:predicted molibdopterin-dependent oxidoreductase YjgC
MNKLVRVCIALAAFAAFAVLPATASAENDATVVNAEHKTEALGSRITGTTNTDTYSRLTTESGEELTRCSTGEISGTLHRNDHAAIEETIDRANFEGHS